MKNRNLDHKDDWATPPFFYEKLNEEFNFNFDPCPFMHDVSEWDGLEVDWGSRTFCNPPYSPKLKDAFVKKAVSESWAGKKVVMLLPVSTSSKLFHEWIQPFASEIRFVKGRLPFIGINKYGEYVNWHLWDKAPPEGSTQVKNTGQHDSMVVIFG